MVGNTEIVNAAVATQQPHRWTLLLKLVEVEERAIRIGALVRNEFLETIQLGDDGPIDFQLPQILFHTLQYIKLALTIVIAVASLIWRLPWLALVNSEVLLRLLPVEAKDFLLSQEFVDDCIAQFKELDEDGNGVLTAEELYPVLTTLTSDSPWAVSMDHCERFAKIFDTDGNGVLTIDEFVGFCRFLILTSWTSREDKEVGGCCAMRLAVCTGPLLTSQNNPLACTSSTN